MWNRYISSAGCINRLRYMCTVYVHSKTLLSIKKGSLSHSRLDGSPNYGSSLQDIKKHATWLCCMKFEVTLVINRTVLSWELKEFYNYAFGMFSFLPPKCAWEEELGWLNRNTLFSEAIIFSLFPQNWVLEVWSPRWFVMDTDGSHGWCDTHSKACLRELITFLQYIFLMVLIV